MNDSRTEVDSSKRPSLVDGTPSRKWRHVEELVLTNQNGSTPLGGEIDAFEDDLEDDDNHHEENSIELKAKATPRDEEIGMQEFHIEMYETLPEHPYLAFVRRKEHNDNPVLVIPPDGVVPF